MAFKLFFFVTVLCILISQCSDVLANVTLIPQSISSSRPLSANSVSRLRKFGKRAPLKKGKLLNSAYIHDLKKTIQEKIKKKFSKGDRPLGGIINAIRPLGVKLLRRKNGTFRPLKKLGNIRPLIGMLTGLRPIKPITKRKPVTYRLFKGKRENRFPESTTFRNRRLLGKLDMNNTTRHGRLSKLKRNGIAMKQKKSLFGILKKNGSKAKSGRFFRRSDVANKSKGGSKTSKLSLGARLSNVKAGVAFKNGRKSESNILKNLKSSGLFKKRGTKKSRFSLEKVPTSSETRKGLFGRLGQKSLLNFGGLKIGGGNRLGGLNLGGNAERKNRFGQIATQLSDPQTIQAVANVLVAGMTMMAGGVPGGYRSANEPTADSATKPAQAPFMEPAEPPSLASKLGLGGRIFGRRLFGKSLFTLKRRSSASRINKPVFDGKMGKTKAKGITGNIKLTKKAKLLSRIRNNKLVRLQNKIARKFGHKMFKAKRRIFGRTLPALGPKLSRWHPIPIYSKGTYATTEAPSTTEQSAISNPAVTSSTTTVPFTAISGSITTAT